MTKLLSRPKSQRSPERPKSQRSPERQKSQRSPKDVAETQGASTISFVGQVSTPAFSIVTSLFALRKEQPKEKLLPLPVAIHRSNVIYYHPKRVARPEPSERGEVLANGEERFSPLFFF